MENIKSINLASNEGKLLLCALSMMTTSADVTVMGESINGRQTTPDDMLKHVEKLAVHMYGPDWEKKLTTELVTALQGSKEPGSYYHGWQSNIAVAMQDELRAFVKQYNVRMSTREMHEISNKAAIRFLDQVTNALP